MMQGVLNNSRVALSCAIIAMLAGCGGLQPPPAAAPGALTQSVHSGTSSSYSVLYRFSGKDGANPVGGLINMHGTLYGTTQGGVRRFAHHYGTIFSITTTGKEKLLHSFGGPPDDGAKPVADMIGVKGTLYGTTPYGGAGCGGACGTVFSITRTGTEKVLYSFVRASDGAVPFAGLIYVNGTLYGTTTTGGGSGSRSGCTNVGCGTVFTVTTSGAEKVLYSFLGGRDGADPRASLINVDGTLYGTTFDGGSDFGEGTVFKVTTSGTEKVLYCFCGGTGDGAYPAAALVNVNGTLYGTTDYGGNTSMCSNGCGTVFSVTTRGSETVLYRFHGPDGAVPMSGLINVNGTLYGTTFAGGANGYGTVFSVTTTGQEKVLYSFAGGSDGVWPFAGLINVNGTLYGTTYYGGGLGCLHNGGCGTVFAFTP